MLNYSKKRCHLIIFAALAFLSSNKNDASFDPPEGGRIQYTNKNDASNYGGSSDPTGTGKSLSDQVWYWDPNQSPGKKMRILNAVSSLSMGYGIYWPNGGSSVCGNRYAVTDAWGTGEGAQSSPNTFCDTSEEHFHMPDPITKKDVTSRVQGWGKSSNILSASLFCDEPPINDLGCMRKWLISYQNWPYRTVLVPEIYAPGPKGLQIVGLNGWTYVIPDGQQTGDLTQNTNLGGGISQAIYGLLTELTTAPQTETLLIKTAPSFPWTIQNMTFTCNTFRHLDAVSAVTIKQLPDDFSIKTVPLPLPATINATTGSICTGGILQFDIKELGHHSAQLSNLVNSTKPNTIIIDKNSTGDNVSISCASPAQTIINSITYPAYMQLAATCKPIAAATFISGSPALPTCTYSCNPGYYSNGTTCVACNGGTYLPTAGASSVSSCMPCPAGQYSLAGSVSCLACPVNTQANLGAKAGSTSCTPCPAGSDSQSKTGVTSCTQCPAGQISISGSSCTACPANTYTKNGLTCTPCPANASCSLGASMFSCNPGYYSNGTTCLACNAGTYLPTAGATSVSSCMPCPSGQYSSAGSNNCSMCPVNTYLKSSAGSTVCTPCPAGSDSQSKTGVTSCTPCPAGQISTIGGSCAACPANTQANLGANTGSTSCSPCPAGQGSTAGSVCSPCPTGQYAQTAGKGCLQCPANTFSNAPGATFCPYCPSGTYAAYPGSTSCNVCPLNLANGMIRQSAAGSGCCAANASAQVPTNGTAIGGNSTPQGVCVSGGSVAQGSRY